MKLNVHNVDFGGGILPTVTLAKKSSDTRSNGSFWLTNSTVTNETRLHYDICNDNGIYTYIIFIKILTLRNVTFHLFGCWSNNNL